MVKIGEIRIRIIDIIKYVGLTSENTIVVTHHNGYGNGTAEITRVVLTETEYLETIKILDTLLIER